MRTLLLIIQAIISLILIGLILLQNSKGGLTAGVGGGEAYRTKRGAEKVIFGATIASGIIFLIISIINLLVK